MSPCCWEIWASVLLLPALFLTLGFSLSPLYSSQSYHAPWISFLAPGTFFCCKYSPIIFALFSSSCYLIIAALFLLGFLYGSYLSSGFLYITVGLTSIKFWCHSSELLLPVFHNLLVSLCSCQCLSASLTQLNSSQMYPSTEWRALSWSGSQGCVKKATKMLKSTTWNEDSFALSLPQSLRVEPICLNPPWCSTCPTMWPSAKVQFCFEIRCR